MRIVVFFLIIAFSIVLGVFAGQYVGLRVHPSAIEAPEGLDGHGSTDYMAAQRSINREFDVIAARAPYLMCGVVGGGVFGLVACVVYDRKFPRPTKS